MKADIGRVTFEPDRNYQRVVMQQGRVQLESDFNEQIAILVQGARRLAADLIGPWGGTEGAFSIEETPGDANDFEIGRGRYYVDGIACESAGVSYRSQPYLPIAKDEPLVGEPSGSSNRQQHCLVYVDVWELLVTAAEDENLREVALGGPDTSARTRVVWQVRLIELPQETFSKLDCLTISDRWDDLLHQFASPVRGKLRARAKVTDTELDSPCAIDPRASYRFDENALFRVEVHNPGSAGEATFKWSLDNGTVVFAVERFAGRRVALASLGRDARLTLQAGDHVELEYDSYVLRNRADDLFVVASVDYADLTVTLDREPAPVAASEHPRLRRWDQQSSDEVELRDDGTILIVEQDDASDGWTNLRYGVQIQFVQNPSERDSNSSYRTGDYWLIPARTATGDVIWPREDDDAGGTVPAARGPNGVEHHYAPLAYIGLDGTILEVGQRFVRTISPLANCPTGNI